LPYLKLNHRNLSQEARKGKKKPAHLARDFTGGRAHATLGVLCGILCVPLRLALMFRQLTAEGAEVSQRNAENFKWMPRRLRIANRRPDPELVSSVRCRCIRKVSERGNAVAPRHPRSVRRTANPGHVAVTSRYQWNAIPNEQGPH
jgi:hypothetical protein